VKLNPLAKGIALACSAMALSATSTVKADDQAGTDARELDRVTVTGSRLSRVDVESVSPTSVIGREELETAGISSAFDILTRIPSAGSGSFTEAGNEADGTSPGTAGIGLRGLPANATLVLLNGRRLANAPMAMDITVNFADLNTIPVSAIDRVEILKDGASAVYGTDAIAGVVNIITRRPEDGMTVGADYGISGQSDAEEYRVYANWGAQGERASILTGFEFTDRDTLMMSDRSFSASADKRNMGGFDFRSGLGSNPGSYFLQDSGVWQADPACPEDRINPEPSTGGTLCVYDFAPDMMNRPEEQSAKVFAFSEFDLGGGHLLYSEFMANERRSEITGAATPTVGDLTMDADNAFNPFDEDVTVRYRYTDVGPRVQDNQHNSLRSVWGAAGPLTGSWEYDTSLILQRHSAWQRGIGGFINGPRSQQAISDEVYNPFLPEGESNTAEAIDAVETTTNRTAVSSLQALEFNADGDLMMMPGGMAGMAVGAQLREERIRDTPDEQFLREEIVGTEATNASGSRSVDSLYTEVYLPFHETFEAQVALRHDDYSDFGSTTNPRIGLSYRPTNQLMFRASWSEGFRAPSIAEIGLLPTEQSPILNDPLNPDEGPIERIVRFEGNPDLQPEESESIILGVVADPLEWLSISFDYWKITHDNLIDSDTQFVIDQAAAGVEEFQDRVVRGPGGNIDFVEDTFLNFGYQEVSGYDIDVRMTFDGMGGQFTWNTEFSWLANYERQLREGQARQHLEGTFERPQLRAYSRLAWTDNNWGYSAALRHVGNYTEENNPFGLAATMEGVPMEDRSVAGWNAFDVGAWINVNEGGRAFFHVDNILDEDPPFVMASVWGYDTRNHDPRGRFFRMGYQHNF